MAQTINDRIELIINERFSGNKAAFAKSIGLPPTGMSNYLGKQRRSKPNIDMVTNIVVNLGIDPLWLLTGKEKQNSIITDGDYSPASIGGNATVNTTCNQELESKVALLEQLIKEKERTIQILMERK